MTSYFHSGCSDLDEIRQSDAELHPAYGEMVKIETGSRISIWRRLYFETGNSYISAANEDIWTKFGLLLDFDLLQAVTSKNTNRK